MVLPIVQGPYVYEELVHTDSFGVQRPWYQKRTRVTKQSKPYDRRLPYECRVSDLSGFISEDDLHGPLISHPETFLQQEYLGAVDRTYNRAYSKIVNAIRQGEQVQTAMNLATAGMTVDLLKNTRVRIAKVVSIGGIAKLLESFAELIRRGQHKKAVGVLQKRMPKTVSKRLAAMRRRGEFRDFGRDIAQEYLMLHFAWSPLLGDLYNGLEFLRSGYTENPYPVNERARSRYHRSRITEGSYKHSYAQPDKIERGTGFVSCRIGLTAQVTSVPLFVLNRLGLVNPALVAWDLIPFSFVVGWFGNFEQMLAAPTDRVGVDISDVYVTRFVKHQVFYSDVQWSYTDGGWKRFMQDGKYVDMKRTVGDLYLPSFELAVPVTGWRRALAQVSLLTLFGINPSSKGASRR